MTLPEGWVEVTLGDICSRIVDGSHNPPPAIAGGRPMLSARNINGGRISFDQLRPISNPAFEIENRRTQIGPDTVLVTIVGALGRAAVVPDDAEPFTVQRSVGVLHPLQVADPQFIARQFDAADAQRWFEDNARGTAQKGVYLKTLATFPVSMPGKAEQRRIVAKLDALTARLTRARAELDRVPFLAEQGHLSILRSGVTGALTSDWRETAELESIHDLLERVPAPQQGRGGREATEKVIPGKAALAVNDPTTDLPIGWEWVPLLRLAKQETGHTPSRSRSDYWDGGVPWIGIRDAGAHHGGVIDETMQTISDAGLANSSARMLPAGTVCLSRTASVGYVTVMGKAMATSQDFATWTCTEALVPEYLMYVLMAEGDDIRNFGMGSTHTTIYFPEVRAFHIALPPIAEQREIVERIRSGLARADRLEAEAARARALIDRLESAILAKAFRGELVPQDPNDEPASVLLDRIRAERAAAPKPKRGRAAKASA